jgi:hypothetical protein
MNDLESRLRQAGVRWRAVQPPRHGPIDPAAFESGGEPRPSWLMAAASALVAILVIGIATQVANRSGPATSVQPPPNPQTTATPAAASQGCDVTIPDPPFIAPPPNPASPGTTGKVWYGSKDLWALLDSEGEVWDRTGWRPGSSAFSQKTFWDSVNWPGVPGEPEPAITVSGTRLDGPGRFTSGPATNAGNSELGDMMLVGIEIPSPGCWKITGRYRGAELSYVVWIVDPVTLPDGTFVSDEPIGDLCIAVTVREEPARVAAYGVQWWSAPPGPGCVTSTGLIRRTSSVVGDIGSFVDGRMIEFEIGLLPSGSQTVRLEVIRADADGFVTFSLGSSAAPAIKSGVETHFSRHDPIPSGG